VFKFFFETEIPKFSSEVISALLAERKHCLSGDSYHIRVLFLLFHRKHFLLGVSKDLSDGCPKGSG
jgi:hypothetical protein